MNIFANDVSAYLANILCSLIGDLDFMMFNSAQFFSTLSGKMIQESEITESFDVELLFTNILADTATSLPGRNWRMIQAYPSAWQKHVV